MQFLILVNPDFSPFDPSAVERALRSCDSFTHLRNSEPGGALIECQYIEPDDWTFVRLSCDAAGITIDHTSGAALKAAILVQKHLGVPIRMIDDDNSFDLIFSGIQSVEELEAAIENAQKP